ncbi:MAG: hypothetical protein ABIL76_02330 [candidate division WOR-3 bacterium]
MKVIKINKVKNYKMIRAGNFVLREEWEEFYKKYKKKLDIIKVFENWIIKKDLNDERARIYLFTINKKIVKI